MRKTKQFRLLRADLHQTLNDSAGIIGIIFSARVQPAVNSFSRVARSRSSASAGCWVVFSSGISQLLSRPFSRAASAASTISCSLIPASCAISFTTRPPDLFAASNRWLNWLVRSQLLYSVLLILLYQLAQVWLRQGQNVDESPPPGGWIHYQAPGFTALPDSIYPRE